MVAFRCQLFLRKQFHFFLFFIDCEASCTNNLILYLYLEDDAIRINSYHGMLTKIMNVTPAIERGCFSIQLKHYCRQF